MKLNQQDLEKIADLTLEHYNRRAEDFWEGTRDHDVSQNIAALLRYIEVTRRSRYSILAAGRDVTSRRSPNSVTSRYGPLAQRLSGRGCLAHQAYQRHRGPDHKYQGSHVYRSKMAYPIVLESSRVVHREGNHQTHDRGNHCGYPRPPRAGAHSIPC